MKAAKEQWIDDKCTAIEDNLTRHIARKLIKLSKTSQLTEKVKSAQSRIREEIALPKKTKL